MKKALGLNHMEISDYLTIVVVTKGAWLWAICDCRDILEGITLNSPILSLFYKK